MKVLNVIVLQLLITTTMSAYVSFDDSMGKYYPSPNFTAQLALLKSLYTANNLYSYIKTMVHGQHKPRIPKIIHIIWLGSPISHQIKKNIKSFKRHHPDWQLLVWQDEDLNKLQLQNQEFYSISQNYGQRSDIARYEILYRFGGLYVDCDFKCLKPFDILHDAYDFYTGILKIGKRCVGLANGLIASVPGHPILKHCIETMKVGPKESKKKITQTTGPKHFTTSFFAEISSCMDNTIVLPASYFYPAPNTKRLQSVKAMNKYIQPETFAIHYWTNSWKKDTALIKRSRLKWYWFNA